MRFYYGCAILLCLVGCMGYSHSYTFGMLSHDDTITSIQTIEENNDISLPMVSFIRDEYSTHEQTTVHELGSTLGTGRVYHITLSPKAYTAQQVYEGYYDREYNLFFKHIKQAGIKVIFRTMHEMNGGWYPWSGNPIMFQKARRHIHQLSRNAGLDQGQILFDFSTNGRDMPTDSGHQASQSASLIKCTIAAQKANGCLTWSDYYPGDDVVDMMGVSFYNRGKATSDRARYTPTQIMEEPDFMIRERLKTKKKPIIIDEVGTSSVRYNGRYDRNTSLQYYETNSGSAIKNKRIEQLAVRAQHKPELVALSYFNVDRTMGLAWENPGEADWSAIDLDYGRYYSSIMKLYQGGNKNLITQFVSPIEQKKQHIGTWKKGIIKKKKAT